jgi:hypothetical protein
MLIKQNQDLMKRLKGKNKEETDDDSCSVDNDCNVMNVECDSNNNNSENSSDYSLYPLVNLQPKKRVKHTHYSPDIIVEVENQAGKRVPIRCLLDTGTSSTIILRPHVKQGRISHHKSSEATTWKTMGGTFTTKRKALIDFKFPELNDKTITTV